MPKKCFVTGKSTKFSTQRSHAMNASRRTLKPNLQRIKIIDPETGRVRRVWVTAKVIKTGKLQRA